MRRCALFLGLSLLAPAAARAVDPNVITRIAVEERGGDAVLVVEGSRPPSFTTWTTPQRFVVEVAGATLRTPASELSRESGAIASVRAEERASVGATKTRVAVMLRGDPDGAEVTTDGNSIFIAFKEPAGAGPVATAAPAPAAAEPEPPAAAPTPAPTPAPTAKRPRFKTRTATASETPSASHATKIATSEPPAQDVRELGFRPLPDGARVFLRTGSAPRFALEERNEKLLLVKLDRARVRPNDERPLDLRFFAGPVARVTPRRVGGSYVLEIALREKVSYEQRVEGDLLAIDFRTPAK
jgi:hypothetical protein